MRACELSSPERSLRAMKQAVFIGIYFPAYGKMLILDFRPETTGTPRVIV